MNVITRENLLDYNSFKTPAIMDGDESMYFEAKAFLKKAIAKNQEVTLAKSMYFTKGELSVRPKAGLMRLFNESIQAAKDSSCQAILVEPPLWDKKASLNKEEVERIYLEAAESLKGTDKSIYVKNQYDIYNGSKNRGFHSDAYQLKNFIESLNEKAGREVFKLALDTGVANLCGQSIPELIQVLKDNLALIILIENNGTEDSTALPFSNFSEDKSWIDWMSVIKTLRRINYNGDILVNINTNTSAIPSPLRPVIANHAKEIGNYFGWLIDLDNTIRKYESRVLFGAGNMCRIYMEQYGKDYPPLFTCDNNKAKWGQEAYGLEIKSPESLRNLDPSTAIFICNMYYDEITAQLEAMNLPNPIERFNDEIF